MKKIKPVELFLTLGLVTTLGACNTSAPDGGESGEGGEGATTEEVRTDAQSDHGGEGGEGGEGGSSGNPDVDYMTTLALMQGHLQVADELIDQGNYEEAEPHIGHPVDELYGDVEGQLDERGVEDFKSTLNSLHDLIKTTPDAPEVATNYQESIAAIDEAIAALGDEHLNSPEFVLQVVNDVLQVAGEEYSAAIADGKFVEIVEYQDSRGFVLYAEQLYNNVADQLSPEANSAITSAFSELKTAWPSVNPPETPVKSPQEVLSLIIEIEAETNS